MDRSIRNAGPADNHRFPIPIDICIPIYRHDPSILIRQLSRQHGAADCRLHIYDDGSEDPQLTLAISDALAGFPGQTLLTTATVNHGRAAARNALIAAATSDWLLFLDGDMQIDGQDFLTNYAHAARDQAKPCTIVGGFGIDLSTVTRATMLHALQSRKSECLTALMRNSDPGRFVFSSNIFLHREIIEKVQFNPKFHGWGWEDVDWGLSVARQFPVIHIDNAAIHLGLDEDAALLRKYEMSGPNFLLMLEDHPESVRRMPIYRYARLASYLPLLGMLTRATRRAATAIHLPTHFRLLALKMFRVSVYAQVLLAYGH